MMMMMMIIIIIIIIIVLAVKIWSIGCIIRAAHVTHFVT